MKLGTIGRSGVDEVAAMREQIREKRIENARKNHQYGPSQTQRRTLIGRNFGVVTGVTDANGHQCRSTPHEPRLF